MMFWLIVVGYVVGVLVTMRAVFNYEMRQGLRKYGNDAEYARSKVLEYEIVPVLFWGFLWFIILPGFVVYKIIEKTVFGQTPAEKKVKLEREREKLARDAARAEMTLKREGWKV